MPSPGDESVNSDPAVGRTAATSRHLRWRSFGVAWAVIATLCSLWALATPISAAPDEPAHLIKAASVARGEFIGEASSLGHVVSVPRYIARSHTVTCFAFDNTEAADCAPAPTGDQAEIVKATTTAGLYNPLYYAVVGLPSLVIDTDAGVYAMRVVSALFTSLFLALSFMMVSTWRRPGLPTLTIAVTTTPMLLFLSGTVNPNGVEATATLAVFVAMLSIIREPNPALLNGRSAMLILSALVAVNSRGLSPIWLAVAVIAPLFLLRWKDLRALLSQKAVIAAIAGVVVVTGLALAWALGTSSLTAAIGDTDAPLVPGTGSPAAYGFVLTLLNTFEYDAQLVGVFGWLDTAAPVAAQFVWAGLIAGLLLGGVALSRRRELFVFLGLAAAFVLLPAIIQGLYVTGGGYIWQGRYNFPLFACLLLAAAAFAADKVPPLPDRSSKVALGVTVGSMAVAQFYTFVFVLRRYVVGLDDSWLDFVRAPEWVPPGGAILAVILFGLAISGTAVLLTRTLRRSARQGLASAQPLPHLVDDKAGSTVL